MLNYLGQGAYLLSGAPVTGGMLFYSMTPAALLYPMVALATFATIIASQSLISGAFSLSLQAIRLGLFPRMVYEEQTFHLQQGDLLAIYSDGVTEANNSQEQEFSLERFIAVLKAKRENPASEIVDTVIQEIDAFVGSAPQFDDITLMVMKRI